MKNKYCANTAYDRKIASSYEEDRIVEPLWNKEQAFADQFLRTVPKESIILDIPVGTGRFFRFYEANNLQVIGMDISKDMLIEAENKIAASQVLQSTVQLKVADITALPLENNSVHVAICWRLFHLLPEPVLLQAIKELSRVTKNQVLIQVYNTRPGNPLLSFAGKLLASVRKAVKNMNKASNNQEEPWSHIDSYAHAENKIIREFENNKFALKGKTIIDHYKGDPVSAYLFEKTFKA